VQIPLAMGADGLSRSALGVVAATYAAGFMAGAWFGPRLLARVGHIRVFAACAAIATACTLALHAADTTLLWMLVRAAMGAGVALMFSAVEAWMNETIGKHERGSVIGVYMVCTKAALAAGAFLAVGGGASPVPLMIAAALIALAIAPVCFTTSVPPAAPKAEPLAIRDQFRTAPAAVLSSFCAGVTNGGALALAPVFAAEFYGPERAATFYASAWIGSLILQWPAGRVSDMVDRRLVIAALAVLSAVAALGLLFTAGHVPFWAAALMFGVWGAGSLSFYGIGVAHMADRSDPSQMARATAGLLFVWAFGCIVGPIAQGPLVDLFGPQAVFGFAAVALFGLTGAMLYRRSAREPTPAQEKAPFQNKSATSTSAAELSYGEADTAAPRAGST
jgi:MFS family permease